MASDYLWDRSGEDAETQKLELLLSPYRFRGGQAILPVRTVNWWQLAAAAAIMIVAGAEMWWTWQPPGDVWRATEVSGRATVSPRTTLHSGAIVQTAEASRVRLESGAIGVVEVAENTTIQLIENRSGRHVLALRAGTIHARTTSPPGVFVVDTPRARAIDLGCEYRLSIAPNGAGVLRVSAGWVELQRGFDQSLVPQGATADIRRDGELTPPYFDDARPEFKSAVRQFAFSDADSRHEALTRILSLARRRDALTLLNLFSRATPDERLLVYDRLNQLVPAPVTVPRDAVRSWTPLVTEPWWPPVLQASGVSAIKKKKGMLRGL